MRLPDRPRGAMRSLNLVLRVLRRLLARIRIGRRYYRNRSSGSDGSQARGANGARTHLAVAPQVDVRLEHRERGDVVRDVVHLRRLERAVTWVPRRAGIRRRFGLLTCSGWEVGPCLPFVTLRRCQAA